MNVDVTALIQIVTNLLSSFFSWLFSHIKRVAYEKWKDEKSSAISAQKSAKTKEEMMDAVKKVRDTIRDIRR